MSRWLTALGSSDKFESRIPTGKPAKPTGVPPSTVFTNAPTEDSKTPPEALIQDTSLQLLAYLRGERERYLAQGRGLNNAARAQFGRFFSQELLWKILVVVLTGQRLTNPSLFAEGSRLGAINLPDVTHMASVTFLDVIVFNEQITDRELFHALVQTAQVHVLGPRFYTELFVRGVMRTQSYALAHLQAQAFALDARFATNPEVAFSVEGEIRTWLDEGRY